MFSTRFSPIVLVFLAAVVSSAALGESHVPSAGSGAATIPAEWLACKSDADCTTIEVGCCDHCNGGTILPISGKFGPAALERYKKKDCRNSNCTERACAGASAVCVQGRCCQKERWRSTGDSPSCDGWTAFLKPSQQIKVKLIQPQSDLAAVLLVPSISYKVAPELADAKLRTLLEAMQHPVTSIYTADGLHKQETRPSPGELDRLDRRYTELSGKPQREFPLAPGYVNLTLQVKNNGKQPVHLVDQGALFWGVDLAGPGAITIFGSRGVGELPSISHWITIAPGQSHNFNLRSLQFGESDSQCGAYWTKPGQYTLRVRLATVFARTPSPPSTTHDQFKLEFVSEAVPLTVL